jgi:spermidine synthase
VFFELCRKHLTPGGVVVINVGHPTGESSLEKALGRTLGSAFPVVLRDPAQPTNTQLIATSAPASGTALANRAQTLPSDLRDLAAATASRIRPPLAGGEVLTDDRAPVEWLIDRSIVEYAARGGH